VLTPAARLWLRRLVDGTCVNSTFTEFVRSRGLGESLAEDKFLLKWAATLIHADAAHQPVTYSFEPSAFSFYYSKYVTPSGDLVAEAFDPASNPHVSSLRGANEVRCKTQRVQAPDVCASTQKRSFNLLSDDAESLMRKHRELELVLSKLVLSVTAVPTANSATADTIPTVKSDSTHVKFVIGNNKPVTATARIHDFHSGTALTVPNPMRLRGVQLQIDIGGCLGPYVGKITPGQSSDVFEFSFPVPLLAPQDLLHGTSDRLRDAHPVDRHKAKQQLGQRANQLFSCKLRFTFDFEAATVGQSVTASQEVWFSRKPPSLGTQLKKVLCKAVQGYDALSEPQKKAVGLVLKKGAGVVLPLVSTCLVGLPLPYV
jgi:hypothetical protein